MFGKKKKYRVEDDSVTVRGRGRPEFSGKSVTKRGEDEVKRSTEPGRINEQPGQGDAAGREEGTSTARFITSVNPQDPIDPKMPKIY